VFQIRYAVIAALAAAAMQPGCSRTAADSPASTSTAVPTSTGTRSPSAVAGAPAVGETLAGTVAETMDAGNYTYVRLTTGSGDVWAATSRFTVAVGDRITVPVETPMTNFHSQTLNRDFPIIYFASHIAREGEPASAAPAPASPMPGHASAPPAAASGPVAPAPGSTTIAEVWAKSRALAGKPVTVRGKVVKYNAGILGVNWVHLQDGSGKAEDRTNDLTVTTNESCAVGDVVTMSGTLALDKDFGAGYSYPVILEQARLRRQ
jgi:hypothetical protein